MKRNKGIWEYFPHGLGSGVKELGHAFPVGFAAHGTVGLVAHLDHTDIYTGFFQQMQ